MEREWTRNLPSQVSIFKGHVDGVSGFSMWGGQDIVSISKNRIGLSSLSKSLDEDGVYQVMPQKLNMGNHGMRSLSALTCICILPFSRLFLIGTEDGYLRTCC